MHEDALMMSQNFEFLRPRHRELADLGGFAEAYARPDPASALVKLRSFAETVVAVILGKLRELEAEIAKDLKALEGML